MQRWGWRITRWRGRAGVVAATAVASGLGGVVGAAPPAAAECISGEVVASILGAPPEYVLGPEMCIVPTPFERCFTGGPHATEPGTVDVRVTVWLVCPD